MMKSSFFGLLVCVCCCFAGERVSAVAAYADSSDINNRDNLPVVGLGYGALTFIGDISNNGYTQPFYYKGGTQLQVQLHSNSNLEIFFHLLAGKVYGEERSMTRNLNFTSNIFTAGANIRYAFKSRNNPNQVLIPFVSVGIESITFNPYSDLKDANGNTYYYWTDGTIRNMAEGSSDAAQAQLLHRDYSYETNVRDADLDSLGSFNTYAFAFPISVGVKFRVSNRVALHFTGTYHLTTTDNIDGITEKSKGSRAGNSSNDNFLYTAVSFHYDLSAPREAVKRAANPYADEALYKNVNYEALESADTDGDGVPDFLDDDSSTPRGIPVDAHGRAIDSDGDGVPDFRDKEPNSAARAWVDENGLAITDSMQEAKYIQDSLDLEVMAKVERVKSQNETSVSGGSKGNLPDEYKVVDTNKDGAISADEIAKAIELYTTGKSPFNRQQFYRLVDYFFGQ